MSKIINLSYKASKIWATLWYFLIPLSIYSALIQKTFGFSDLVFYSFIMATIATTPLAIMRYVKSQKQKELKKCNLAMEKR